VVVDRGAEGDRGIGHAAREHEIRALLEGINDRVDADVRVRGDEALPVVRQRLAGLPVGEFVAIFDPPVEVRHHVVAGHEGDLPAGQPVLRQHLRRGLRAAVRIDAAGVRDDLQARLIAPEGADPIEDLDEVVGVARLGIAAHLLRQDGERHLGEVVHREEVEAPRLHQLVRPLGGVPPEAAAVSDPDDSHTAPSLVPD